MHLTFNIRCHYFLSRRAVVRLCREKKNKQEREEKKIVMAVYTRLFQIGWKSHPWAGDTACEKCNKKFARTETYLTRNRKMVTRVAILHYIHIFLTHTTWLKQCGSWIRHSEAVSTTTDKVEQISGVKYIRPSKSSCLRFKMRNKINGKQFTFPVFKAFIEANQHSSWTLLLFLPYLFFKPLWHAICATFSWSHN